jgi:hypothetical protein
VPVLFGPYQLSTTDANEQRDTHRMKKTRKLLATIFRHFPERSFRKEKKRKLIICLTNPVMQIPKVMITYCMCENPCAPILGAGRISDLGIFAIVFKLSLQLPPDKLVDIARFRCGTPTFSIDRSVLGKYKDLGFASINISHQWQ